MPHVISTLRKVWTKEPVKPRGKEDRIPGELRTAREKEFLARLCKVNLKQ